MRGLPETKQTGNVGYSSTLPATCTWRLCKHLEDLTARERHAICQHMVLSVYPMGHDIQATTLELERDLTQFEREHKIDDQRESQVRDKAIRIAHKAHDVIILHPFVSPRMLYDYVPQWACRILRLSRPSPNYYDRGARYFRDRAGRQSGRLTINSRSAGSTVSGQRSQRAGPGKAYVLQAAGSGIV